MIFSVIIICQPCFSWRRRLMMFFLLHNNIVVLAEDVREMAAAEAA
jgi:hypothetical protein